LIRNRGFHIDHLGHAHFAGNDGVNGNQLWQSNGTASGTAIVAEINGTAGSNIANLTATNGLLFCTAYTTQNGYQAWQSDGTAAGTVVDTSLNTGGSNVPTDFVVMGTTLFFTAPGASLWSMPT
jgi:ELWxxDGT repeat protein